MPNIHVRLIGIGLALLMAGCGRAKSTAPTFPEMRFTGAEQAVDAAAAPNPEAANEAAQLAEQLSDPDINVSACAASTLASMEEGLPHLVEGWQHRNWEVRFTCLQVVERTKLKEHASQTVPGLQRLLKDSNALLRREAAYRLAWLGDAARQALPQLDQLAAQDPSPDVRATAADVVVELNTTPPALQQLLQNRSPLIRMRAARTLAGLQKQAQGALPALQYLASNDADASVRQAAAQASQCIRRALAMN